MESINSYTVDASLDDEMSTRMTIDYELAGRFPSHTFNDLRSASKARRRNKANLEKYYSYRGVNAGQIGRQHHKLPSYFEEDKTLPADAPTITMTKQDFYREAQCYPRPPTYHRRPREYARWTKTCGKEKQRHARKHASQQLNNHAAESLEYYFMSYVTGHGDERDLDEHTFRRCSVCWEELEDYYVMNQMFDCNGEAVGQWEDRWDVGFEGVEEGRRFGFAGRAKAGDVFLMGSEDWRVLTRWEWNCEGGGWEEWYVEPGYESECEDDVGSEVWSWSDVLSTRDVVGDGDGEWDVVSSCSSWSHVSG